MFSLGSIASDPRLAIPFYNADSLFFPIIYQELFLREGANFLSGLQGLAWTPAFYIFPDLIQYFILRTIFLPLSSQAWEITHLSYAFVQWTILIAGFTYLLCRNSKEERSPKSWVPLLSFGYLVGAALIYFQKNGFVFLPGFHGGILALLPWSWVLFLHWEDNSGRKNFISVFLTVCLLSLSDLLFIPYFLIPILVWDFRRILFPEPSLEKLRALVSIYLPVILGIGFARVLAKLLQSNSYIFFPGTALPVKVTLSGIFRKENISEFSQAFLFLCRENFVFIGFSVLLFLILRSIRKRKEQEKYSFEAIFLFLGVLVPFTFLIYGILFGLLGSGGFQTIDRYFGEIFLGSFGLGFLCVRLALGRPGSYGFVGVFILVVGTFFSYSFVRSGSGISYVPPKIDCVEGLAKKHSWKRGLASFWYVRPLRIFSNRALEPDDYLYDLMLFYWQNRLEWFERDSPYSFAILDGLDEGKVREKFGAPKELLQCEDAKIFVIDDPSGEKSRNFIEENRLKIFLWKTSNPRN